MAAVVFGFALTASGAKAAAPTELDPFEPFNRAMFEFNLFLDRYAVRPAAEIYVAFVPPEARAMVHNFIDNIRLPIDIANSALQGDGARTMRAAGRLLINTTVGIVGLVDVASDIGLEPVEEDFGQTLGVWGAAPGAYLVLPLLGPSTVRDGAGWIVDMLLDPATYLATSDAVLASGGTEATLALTAADVVDGRAQSLELAEGFERNTLDLYVTVRSTYLQKRATLIANGNSSEAASDASSHDPFGSFLDEDLDDYE